MSRQDAATIAAIPSGIGLPNYTSAAYIGATNLWTAFKASETHRHYSDTHHCAFEQSDAGRKPRYNKSNQVPQEFHRPTRSNLGCFAKIDGVAKLNVARIAELTIT